jgi:uncharacterized OsmC-like protein
MTSKIVYLGNLRTESTHIQSGSVLLSDAPTDNQGKGQAFSPTDTVANALGSCMITMMGIKARDLGLDISKTSAKITKFMQDNPRRISGIKVELLVYGCNTLKHQTILEKTAMTCPVFQSLHPDINKDISFNWEAK